MLLAFSVPGEPVVVALRCLIGACPGWSRLQPLEKDLSTEDFGNSCPTPAKIELQIYSILFWYHQIFVVVFFQEVLKLDRINSVIKASMISKAKQLITGFKMHKPIQPTLTLRDTQTFFRHVGAIKLLWFSDQSSAKPQEKGVYKGCNLIKCVTTEMFPLLFLLDKTHTLQTINIVSIFSNNFVTFEEHKIKMIKHFNTKCKSKNMGWWAQRTTLFRTKAVSGTPLLKANMNSSHVALYGWYRWLNVF